MLPNPSLITDVTDPNDISIKIVGYETQAT
jgi:hypothetical protein